MEEHDPGPFAGILPDELIVNYVLVYEVLTEAGTQLEVAVSDGTTTWLAKGMLGEALEIISTGAYEYIDSDDELNDDDR